jgi:protein-S-isoprenylcysteine O-methyltransferase Ste14
MRDPDLVQEFSWPLAMFITGISFLAFFYILTKLNENSPRIFLWIGLVSLVIALLMALAPMFAKSKKSPRPEEIDQ